MLVIPANASYNPIESICFATDLNDTTTLHASELLSGMRPLRPNLNFLHVRHDDNHNTDYDTGLLREVFDRPEEGMKATFTDRRAEDTVGAIFAYRFEKNCELVVMHRPDRSWFHRLLNKSNTSEAVRRANLPLLILTDDEPSSNGEHISGGKDMKDVKDVKLSTR